MRTNVHLIQTRPCIVVGERPTLQETPRARARGTRQNLTIPSGLDLRPMTKTIGPSMGRDWFYSLQMEQLGRNIATAGALELSYRLGRSHSEFEAMRFGKKRDK